MLKKVRALNAENMRDLAVSAEKYYDNNCELFLFRFPTISFNDHLHVHIDTKHPFRTAGAGLQLTTACTTNKVIPISIRCKFALNV